MGFCMGTYALAEHVFNQVENDPGCVPRNKLNYLSKSASSDSVIRLKVN